MTARPDSNMEALCCNKCSYTFVAKRLSGVTQCPRCKTYYHISNGKLNECRKLVLVGAKSYVQKGLRCKFNEPFVVGSPERFQDALATNLFIDVPPSENWMIVYRGGKQQQTFKTDLGNYTLVRGRPLYVNKIVANRLLNISNEIVRIDNKQLLSYLRGKEYFKALFIRDMGLGDVLIFRSCLKDFKRQYPNALVTAVTSERYKTLLRGVADNVDDILSLYDANDYHITANLCRKSELQPYASTMLRADIYAMFMGFEMQEYTMSYELTEEEKRDAFDLLSQHGWNNTQPSVGIQIYASTPHRSWFYGCNIELAHMLARDNIKVVMLHNKSVEFTRRNENIIDLTGKLNVPQFVGVAYWLNVLISPDSSGYHIKESVGNGKALALFSTIHPDLRVRHYKNTEVIWEGFEQPMRCGGPCYDRGCASLACLRYITVPKVYDKVLQLLQEKESNTC